MTRTGTAPKAALLSLLRLLGPDGELTEDAARLPLGLDARGNVLTPGTIGRDYFEEIAQIVNAPGRPDAAQVEAVMLRHGLQPV